MFLLIIDALIGSEFVSRLVYYWLLTVVSQRHYPRCSSASKPCRIKVDMHRISATTETIAAELCSCPASKPCSTDWEGDASRVITRELATTNSGA